MNMLIFFFAPTEDALPITQEEEKDLLGDDDNENNHVASVAPVAVPAQSTPPAVVVREEVRHVEKVEITENVEPPIKTSPTTRASLRRTTSVANTNSSPVKATPAATNRSPIKKQVEPSPPPPIASNKSDSVKVPETKTVDEQKKAAQPVVAVAVAPVESEVEHETAASDSCATDLPASDYEGHGTPPVQHHSQDTQSSSQMTPDGSSYDLEDEDEVNERRNPKTCSERIVEPPPAMISDQTPRPHPYNQRQHPHARQQGAPYPPYRPPNNQQYPPQYRPMPPNHIRPGPGRPMPFGGPNAAGGPPMYGPRGNRMPGIPPHNQRPPLMPPHQMPPGNRPPFGVYPNAPMPPMRGNMPPQHRFPPGAGPGPGFPPMRPGPGPAGNNMMMRPMPQRMPMQQPQPQPQPQPHPLPVGPAQLMGVTPNAVSLLPKRKVLINPNFKGGVQAATSKLFVSQASLNLERYDTNVSFEFQIN